MEQQVLNLFENGVRKFNSRNFYEAHEYFEEIWVNYKVKDRLFIQSLIQLSVAYFHISNMNRNGAIGLFRKTIKKLDIYKNISVNIKNLDEIINCAYISFEKVKSISDMSEFDWSLAPKIIIDEKKPIK